MSSPKNLLLRNQPNSLSRLNTAPNLTTKQLCSIHCNFAYKPMLRKPTSSLLHPVDAVLNRSPPVDGLLGPPLLVRPSLDLTQEIERSVETLGRSLNCCTIPLDRKSSPKIPTSRVQPITCGESTQLCVQMTQTPALSPPTCVSRRPADSGDSREFCVSRRRLRTGLLVYCHRIT